MFEILFIAASNRLPIVMSIANRAISGPINIHGDLTDQMVIRDSGWISMFTEDNQEAYDSTFLAFRIAEHPDVQLPVAFGLDGFIVSHAVEGVLPIAKEVSNGFLPRIPLAYKLDPAKPISMGMFALPEYYMELRYQVKQALESAKVVIPKVFQEWGEITGRFYQMIEPYRMENAEYAFLTLGAFSGNAKAAVEDLRKQGKRIGVLKLRVFRPFPSEDLNQAVRNLKGLIVVERAHSLGGVGGPVYTDVMASIFPFRGKMSVCGYTAGLGGRDLLVSEWITMFQQFIEEPKKDTAPKHEWWGVRQ